jgi:hypothetical protein
MLKSIFPFLLVALGLLLSRCDTLRSVANEAMREPTAAEVGQGLKEALNLGVSNGVNTLSTRDGYFKSPYKILLPPEARAVTDRLKGVPGFSNLENELLERINRGAEEAAKEAGPIFLSAIRSMTFQDAFNILMGADNAATDYLRRTTYSALYDKFKPVMVRALDNIGANKLWRDATTAYNQIPLVNKINTDLGDYVTTEALKGLFAKIEEEERNIRRNPVARTTALLQKVFARQDRNRR